MVCAVSSLERFISLKEIQHLVVTHLTPKHVTSLKAFLEKRNAGGNASQLQITLSNPAKQVLISTMGMATPAVLQKSHSDRPLAAQVSAYQGINNKLSCKFIKYCTHLSECSAYSIGGNAGHL